MFEDASNNFKREKGLLYLCFNGKWCRNNIDNAYKVIDTIDSARISLFRYNESNGKERKIRKLSKATERFSILANPFKIIKTSFSILLSKSWLTRIFYHIIPFFLPATVEFCRRFCRNLCLNPSGKQAVFVFNRFLNLIGWSIPQDRIHEFYCSLLFTFCSYTFNKGLLLQAVTIKFGWGIKFFFCCTRGGPWWTKFTHREFIWNSFGFCECLNFHHKVQNPASQSTGLDNSCM